MTTELFPFRYRDVRTGKWVHARYRATVEEIQQRYGVWEITGAPDIRVGKGVLFAPFRRLSFADLQQIREHAPTPDPEIDRAGRTLAPAFPEVMRVLTTIPGSWVLDGELVATDARGYPSFEGVRRRAVMKLAKSIAAAVPETPAALCAFDVLYARNSDVRVLPLSERRALPTQ